MDSKQIASTLKLTAQLMELHDENPFKVKSLVNAAYKLGKYNFDFVNKSLKEIEEIEGIGKGIAAKIVELTETGTLKETVILLDKTPPGIVDMLQIKGIGPKKIAQLWKNLGVESVGELAYACNENRLISLKGFGEKTQQQIRSQIEFHSGNAGKYHYYKVEKLAKELVEYIKNKYNPALISITGSIRRKCEVTDEVEILIATEKKIDLNDFKKEIDVKINVITCLTEQYYWRLFETTGSKIHLDKVGYLPSMVCKSYSSEEEVYQSFQLPYILPELREGVNEVELARQNNLPVLLEFNDLKGAIHNHTIYSDGLHSIKEMALHCKQMGYEYIGVSDHSKSAVYANGLSENTIHEQHAEIDKLNMELAPFKIFKGIESDILSDGSLDYKDEVLKTFDFVVASIHSNLKMNEENATKRLMKAIENPYITILGHPTGRLLLFRQGYPVNFKKVIDACASNKVIIELNANPYRLDIDWRWIGYCIEKGVLISINPDAHEKNTINDMYYGIQVARKGMLTKKACFNTFNKNEIENYFNLRLNKTS